MKPGNAGTAAVMISEAFWNSDFSADQHVLGQSVAERMTWPLGGSNPPYLSNRLKPN
jgi:hypothetical protein